MKKRLPTEHPNILALWTHLYLVSIPEMYLRSDDDIRTRGITTSGNNDIDRAMHNNTASVYKTIDDIFELHRKGVDVAVVKYEDTEKIYNAIQAHLGAWMNYLRNGVNLYNSPFDDLIELDQFANIVYDKAKFVFTPDAINDLKGGWNSLGIDLSPANFFTKKPKYAHYFKTEEQKRAELSDFEKSLSERNGYSDDFMRVAARYDMRVKQTLSQDLRFGNEKPRNS